MHIGNERIKGVFSDNGFGEGGEITTDDDYITGKNGPQGDLTKLRSDFHVHYNFTNGPSTSDITAHSQKGFYDVYMDKAKIVLYNKENSKGEREIFHEATWETKSVIVKISCDYRSNYFEEFRENMPNGPVEWYYYNFQIQYSYKPGFKDPQPDKIGKFYLGMKVSDFALVFPKLFPNGIALSGQWARKEKLYELDGGWNYDFLNGKLDWYSYDKYLNEINDPNFAKSLNAAKSLINDYTKTYGKPDTTIIGNTSFLNPLEKHHWGYDVIEAKWYNANGMKIKIEFTFMGGKGEYHFLVKIEHFGKDYQ